LSKSTTKRASLPLPLSVLWLQC